MQSNYNQSQSKGQDTYKLTKQIITKSIEYRTVSTNVSQE